MDTSDKWTRIGRLSLNQEKARHSLVAVPDPLQSSLSASAEVFHQHQIRNKRIDLREQDVAAVGRDAEATQRVKFDVGNFFCGALGKAEKLQGVSGCTRGPTFRQTAAPIRRRSPLIAFLRFTFTFNHHFCVTLWGLRAVLIRSLPNQFQLEIRVTSKS